MRSLILLVALSLAAAFVPAHAQRTLPGLSEGVHYRHVGDGRPYAAQPAGTVEVAEVFAYTCPHCAKFAPLLEQWKATLPKHARLVLVPAVSGREDAWARVFFAAQAAKSQAVLHPRLFAAIHETGALPRNVSVAQVQAFANSVPGANPKALAAALADEASLLARMRHANEFAARSDIPGTPALVVAGRYLILGNSYQGLLDNARAVVDALAPANAPTRKTAPVRPAAAPARP